MNVPKYLLFLTFAGFVMAVVSGVPGFAYAALIPGTTLALSYLFEPPAGFSIEREIDGDSTSIGRTLTVRVRLRVRRGGGVVVVRDHVSPGLEIIEGSNKRVFLKLPGKELAVEYTYKLRGTKRGRHTVSPVEVEGHSLLRNMQPSYAVFGKTEVVRVAPKIRNVPRVFVSRLFSKMTAGEPGYSHIGNPSTDFKEIREYRPGDPLRAVNWKATARTGRTLVNEYEPEGRTTAMLFIDATSTMSAGGKGSTAIENAVGLAISLVRALLRINLRVGLYVVGPGKFETPRSGAAAMENFSRLLASVGVSGREESLNGAVEKVKKALMGKEPVTILITNLTPSNLYEAKEAVKMMKRISGRNKAVVVDLNPYWTISDELGSLAHYQKLRFGEELATEIVHWDVSKEPEGVVLKKILGVMNGVRHGRR